MSAPTRIGLVVPSSNTTIETEVPEMLRRTGADYTFHSSRAVLHNVDAESLEAMVGQADRCASELSDARVDAIVYACLVALMARGPGAHDAVEQRLGEVARAGGADPAISSSAGALVRMLRAHGLTRVAILTPYMDALTQLVREYLEAAGITVVDALSLRVPDNVAVGRLDPLRLPELAAGLDLARRRRGDHLGVRADAVAGGHPRRGGAARAAGTLGRDGDGARPPGAAGTAGGGARRGAAARPRAARCQGWLTASRI